jgi:hypothetical protein
MRHHRSVPKVTNMPSRAFWGVFTPPEDGAQLRIEYLRSDPSVARRAGAHDAVEFGEVFGVIALIVVGVAILSTHPPRLSSRRRHPHRIRR